MPGSWGDHLGQVDLVIEKQNGKWVVTDGQTVAKPIFDSAKNAPIVEVTPEIIEAVKHEHEGTINWVRSAVGKTTAPINSYFALVQDDPSIQIVTNAQKWYVEKYIQGSEFAGLPVLSAGAPFKAGGRGGVDYFTDVAAGEIAIKNAADLYLYPNTLQAVLLTGAEVKEWLEMSAGQFNQIDPTKKEEQSLVNTAFPSYNYDVIDGVTYEIDVTKSARYDLNGQVVNPGSHRIVNLKYNGNLIDPKQKFIVATNNYRASGGGKFPGLTGNNIIIQSPDENRQILINYIMEQKTINPSADQNWAFSPIKGDINVSFETSPTAQKYLSTLPNINYVEKLESGFGKYKIQFVKNVQFKDVPKEHWSYNYIHELASYGIVESNTEAMFEPNKAITRGEFVSMLVKSLGLKAKNPTSFTDVTDAQVSEVAAAFEAGITTGTSKTTFEPNKLITRSQMVTMLMRAYKVKNGDIPKATEKKFTDITTLSTESQNSITAAANLEFIQGYGATFNPGRTATRAQAAKVVYLLNK
jgi:2',3'-cyclic-nucleotide 2'-phosphodiesterase / 3'-nucleotidase